MSTTAESVWFEPSRSTKTLTKRILQHDKHDFRDVDFSTYNPLINMISEMLISVKLQHDFRDYTNIILHI